MVLNAGLFHIVWVNIVPPALLGIARSDNVSSTRKRYNMVRMSTLFSRFKRLRWKLTWSYTWVAGLTFLIIATAFLVLLMIVFGFNPLQGGFEVFNEIIAPVITDDIRPITMAHLRNQPVDSALLQADLEQILGNEPLTISGSPYEVEQFASVFVLDAHQNLLASTPQFAALPPDGRFFDPTRLTGDDSLVPLIEAAYAGDTSFDQPYAQVTPEALYLVFVERLPDEAGRLMGVEVVIARTPTPATIFLMVSGIVTGGLLIFTLSAAGVGTLFGWRTARGLSGRLTQLARTTADWGRGNFERYIEDNEKDEIGELGQNLNRVAADLQTLLADKEQVAVLEERDRMARELHDTLAQGVAGLVLQLEAVKHHLEVGEIPESQMIVSEAVLQARDALRKARAAIDDLRADAMFAPDFVEVVTQRAQRFQASTGIAYELDAQLPDNLLLSPSVSLHARRALSEMLTNVARHAQAESVRLRLLLDAGCLLIEVADDGVGMDAEKPVLSGDDVNAGPGHYGIIGLKERARLTGGRLSILSTPESGTTVQLRLPLE